MLKLSETTKYDIRGKEMGEQTRIILKKNISYFRDVAYRLIDNKLSTQETLDMVDGLREEIAELIEGIALQNEKILKRLEENGL